MNSESQIRLIYIFINLFLLVLLCPGVSFADRGMIRPVSDVKVEEPAQRAIIAHNGMKEILILQTDIRANKNNKIVEFMPLPSKPDVSLAPEKCFATLAEIVRKHSLQYFSARRGIGKGVEEAVSVVVSAQLGPHDVTVVEVKDVNEFVKWVREFFQKNNLGEPDFSKDLKATVSDYIERDLRFFAFDIVTVSPETKTVQPLTYIFKTDRIYYPLKVTNLYGGAGIVELFFLLPAAVRTHDNLYIQPAAKYIAEQPAERKWQFLRSQYVRLKPKDLIGLHNLLPALMGEGRAEQNSNLIFFSVKYEGPLFFDKDIQVEPTYAYKEAFSSKDIWDEESTNKNNKLSFDAGYVIRQSITRIINTSPESIIAENAVPFTARQLSAVQEKDDIFFGGGTYQLFKIKNTGRVKIAWTGFANGNAQVFLSYWNGKRFISRSIMNATNNKTYVIEVNRPEEEHFVYILINCTEGDIFTDRLTYSTVQE